MQSTFSFKLFKFNFKQFKLAEELCMTPFLKLAGKLVQLVQFMAYYGSDHVPCSNGEDCYRCR